MLVIGCVLLCITYIILFGSQIRCLKCLKFGYPKAFCKAAVTCAVCAELHPTTKHQCLLKCAIAAQFVLIQS
jgi:hypothetical protein